MTNDNQNTVEGYCFSLGELRRTADDELPESVADFLVLLTLQARNALQGETIRRQNEQEQKAEYLSE